ncbi:GFA family protein [Rhodoblastus acidophilus]|uniref:GFA family protein n=1 Tax=Candidatus Rhodoblastus alkanivorans TaxID=2954117 RepID=A0ABS9Z3Y8_9HYPH|nr:GFA family protein [Candidatus Rhodoblastus alkanivorans]MCI4680370.1 GFA family protein [Candidatus Rhodoblastus alkanivorans]MCI4682390.1 GFA family protein [Candidatus Rhodoblastus alkanivorans]MDI4639695.1 GFA family protein [Rhodoblastus acidophilus]
MSEHKGSCLCGKTTFTLTDDAPTVALCHCTHCQKSSGSAFSVNVLSPRARFSVSGPLKKFDDVGESGKPLRRWFCSECGSPIWTEAEAMPDVAIVKAGGFDDAGWIKPTLEIFCDSKQQWTPLPEGLARFARMPG